MCSYTENYKNRTQTHARRKKHQFESLGEEIHIKNRFVRFQLSRSFFLAAKQWAKARKTFPNESEKNVQKCKIIYKENCEMDLQSS